MPKKWPASVDLQASKESKGLQEQQSHLDSSTPLPRILTISSDSIGEGTSRHAQRSPRWGEKRGKIQFTGEKIQSKGKIRRSLVLDTLPCQPHLGLSQTISSSPKIFIASFSESAGLEHFRCKLILCPPLGHANTILYALLMTHHNTSCFSSPVPETAECSKSEQFWPENAHFHPIFTECAVVLTFQMRPYFFIA